MSTETFFIRGDRLRECRQRLGLTQEDAASAAGLDLSYWSNLERNRAKNPGLLSIRKAAEAVGTSVSYLIGETDDPRHIVAENEPFHSKEYWEGARGTLEPEDFLILERAYLEVMERRRRRRQGVDDAPDDEE